MKINSNITAYTTNNAYLRNEKRYSASSERLSSGFRINRAGDDPANYAIGSKMKAQLEALNKVKTNATTGMSVVETAESAVAELQSMIHRMSELAVKAANGTMSSSDRATIQEEVDQLKAEITRISDTTEFNSMNLLNGDFENKGYCRNVVGVGVENYSDETASGVYDIIFSYEKGYSLDSYCVTGDVFDVFETAFPNVSEVSYSAGQYSFTVSAERYDGSVVSETHSIPKSDIPADGVVKVKSKTDPSKDLIFSFNEKYDYKIQDSSVDRSDKGIKKATDLFGPDTSYRIKTRTWDGVDHVTVTSKNGAEVTFEFNREKLLKDPSKLTEDADGKGTYKDVMEMEICGKGAMRLQVGPDEGEILTLSIPEMSLTKLHIEDLDMTTMRGATIGIEKLKEALSYVNSVRSKLGAYDNRLENTISFVNTSDEALTTSYSRIKDTDMAEEMTEYTNLQVLTQAGMSMLAQANEFPQQALQLLQ
ncbi:MAG: hypothetical protein J5829_03560 [Lachnospiraceae bacterium]|nr:hypothetical protein [Lachnospiraceae bacterium]